MIGTGACQGFKARGFEESHPLNNNNRGNNRRRGRGNNRQQGGQQTNRIDSRARGNAPQLLEKYRKMAHDAHLNGDRVTEEYYLQFADHYFRVIADQKQRQEDARQPNQPRRDDHRQNDYGDDYGSYDDPYGEAPPAPVERAPVERAPRPEREQRQYEPRNEQRNDQRQYEPRNEPRHEQRAPEQAAPPAVEATDEVAEVGSNLYEPPENPFVRDNRASRGLKQRKPRGSRRDEGDEAQGEAEQAPVEAASAPVAQEEPAGFDAAALPPAISAKPTRKRAPKAAPVEAPAAEAEPAAEEKPRRRRTRKAAAGDEAAPEAVEG
ncbi:MULTISPECIES: DUF4167 domain-containing protein [Novosphingobium]|uniref:DUF4167 domain-containing protein n=1 Tax=Novosphingobium TaxID=165696 RepID=UPI0028527D8C|nr:DUF4167 domain-containing protein [Novosphingobium resinovorum]